MNEDELALVEAARRGDVDAFNQLVLRHQTIAYNLAYRLVGEAHAAADATQEAFIAAYNGLAGYRGGGFRAWVLRIVTNTAYDELRRRKRRPAVSLETVSPDADDLIGDDDDGPEAAAIRDALNRAIQNCLDALPRAYRLVAVLADVQGHDYREVASIANLSLGTVKSRLSRARERLRDCLRAAGELLPDIYRLDREPERPANPTPGAPVMKRDD
jgi:RNA polymerase sigma-70 factor (ECF subfamily)